MNPTDWAKLNSLKAKCISCRRCGLGGQFMDNRPCNVFSNMNQEATIMVVGQNPGRDEVAQAEPFVGASGRFFNDTVAATIGMKRVDFYITNVLHCFTPGNRKPEAAELDACLPIISEEIELLKPRLIIALGSVAFERLTGMHGIMKHHGEVVYSIRHGMTPVIGILHPSPYNTNNPALRDVFKAGLERVREFLDQGKANG